MNIQHYKSLLLQRERELTQQANRLDVEARDAQTSDVGDPSDAAVSDQDKAANFQLEDVATRNLQQVRAALQRIEDGTYGFCVDCGRPIEVARLDAVPWTPYCLEDQQKHDRSAPRDEGLVATA